MYSCVQYLRLWSQFPFLFGCEIHQLLASKRKQVHEIKLEKKKIQDSKLQSALPTKLNWFEFVGRTNYIYNKSLSLMLN